MKIEKKDDDNNVNYNNKNIVDRERAKVEQIKNVGKRRRDGAWK